jgi:hypothetical protein
MAKAIKKENRNVNLQKVQELYAEVGKVVTEFESLLQQVRQRIAQYFYDKDSDTLVDTMAIQMLMYDATAKPLSEYFNVVSQYFLKKNHSNLKAKGKIEKEYKSLIDDINKVTSYIKGVGEIRNDIVHSSWYFSSFYGSHIILKAEREKVTKKGMELRELKITKEIFEDTIDIIYDVIKYMNLVGNVIASKDFHKPYTFLQSEKKGNNNFKIDFDTEKKRLFIPDEDHYDTKYLVERTFWHLRKQSEMNMENNLGDFFQNLTISERSIDE